MTKVKVKKVVYPRNYTDKEVSTFDIRWSTLGDTLDTIQSLIYHHGPAATIQEKNYPYCEGTYLGIIIREMETDAAYAKRVDRLEKDIEAREAKEYARLQKKFGGSK